MHSPFTQQSLSKALLFGYLPAKALQSTNSKWKWIILADGSAFCRLHSKLTSLRQLRSSFIVSWNTIPVVQRLAFVYSSSTVEALRIAASPELIFVLHNIWSSPFSTHKKKHRWFLLGEQCQSYSHAASALMIAELACRRCPSRRSEALLKSSVWGV